MKVSQWTGHVVILTSMTMTMTMRASASFVSSCRTPPLTDHHHYPRGQSEFNTAFRRKRSLLRSDPAWIDGDAARPIKISPNQSTINGANGDASNADDSSANDVLEEQKKKNERYITGLLNNLQETLDSWIMNGSPDTRVKACNIITQIQQTSTNTDLSERAVRMATRAGIQIQSSNQNDAATDSYIGNRNNNSDERKTPFSRSVTLSKTDNKDEKQRIQEAKQRLAWEQSRTNNNNDKPTTASSSQTTPPSALSARTSSIKSNANSYMNQLDQGFAAARVAKDKQQFEHAFKAAGAGNDVDSAGINGANTNADVDAEATAQAQAKASLLIAQAGSGTAFQGESLGVGGLDTVLQIIKRRIWVPLAAPPQLLEELGMKPVRGLLLHGPPGCGKTLLARTLGKILSPARPITVVSGPEIMDKFVGSSEANLRALFDNPPPLHPSILEDIDTDAAETLEKHALHVIIMDEFDAMARNRGGRRGSGDQGDAGVARDSVVNQLLAKMDGVEELCVPTLVIGLTNRRSLIDVALLRPGRFEVQIEVPKPKTMEERVSILKVHAKGMWKRGRLLVRDAPQGSMAGNKVQKTENLPTFLELLQHLAKECEGMSGAALAGVCRAAASRALERSVSEFANFVAQDNNDDSVNTPQGAWSTGGSLMEDCVVTVDDFDDAVQDVLEGLKVDDEEDNTSSKKEEEDKEMKKTDSNNMDAAEGLDEAPQ